MAMDAHQEPSVVTWVWGAIAAVFGVAGGLIGNTLKATWFSGGLAARVSALEDDRKEFRDDVKGDLAELKQDMRQLRDAVMCSPACRNFQARGDS